MAMVPASTMRSPHDSPTPNLVLMGCSRRRALSKLPLSAQLRSGSKRMREPAAERDGGMGLGYVAGLETVLGWKRRPSEGHGHGLMCGIQSHGAGLGYGVMCAASYHGVQHPLTVAAAKPVAHPV
eukprot:scaffold83209_cov67-Phaeocystis_antarctica.AAC.4